MNYIEYKVDIYLYYGFDVLVVICVGFDVKYVLIGVGIDFFYVFECIYESFIVYIEVLVYVYVMFNLIEE